MDTMLTLEAPLGIWMILPVAILFAGKFAQGSGRSYERGQDWRFEAFCCAMIEILIIIPTFLALAIQNQT